MALIEDLKKIISPNTDDAVKVDQNINKIIDDIDKEDNSEDQFFDDFFSDD